MLQACPASHTRSEWAARPERLPPVVPEASDRQIKGPRVFPRALIVTAGNAHLDDQILHLGYVALLLQPTVLYSCCEG